MDIRSLLESLGNAGARAGEFVKAAAEDLPGWYNMMGGYAGSPESDTPPPTPEKWLKKWNYPREGSASLFVLRPRFRVVAPGAQIPFNPGVPPVAQNTGNVLNVQAANLPNFYDRPDLINPQEQVFGGAGTGGLQGQQPFRQSLPIYLQGGR